MSKNGVSRHVRAYDRLTAFNSPSRPYYILSCHDGMTRSSVVLGVSIDYNISVLTTIFVSIIHRQFQTTIIIL